MKLASRLSLLSVLNYKREVNMPQRRQDRRRLRAQVLLGLLATLVTVLAQFSGALPTTVAGAAPSTGSSDSPRTPFAELPSDPAASADADAQAAAREEARPAEMAVDNEQIPTEFNIAYEQARASGQQVQLASETTESSISWVQPDGTVHVESAAGPVRTWVDDTWVPVDTTLERTPEGIAPVAVTGDITFSAGGEQPMATLGDGEGTAVSLDWAGPLPEPELNGATATYRNVLPDVDLVLTATRVGFEQHVVVNTRPNAATLAELSSLEFPLASDGATVHAGEGDELSVVDDQTGQVVGGAASPLMWDARIDPRTDEPVAVQDIGLDLAPATEAGTDATLVLTPPAAFLTDPATVYPVVIDPTQVLGAIGDTFVQTGIANTPQGGSTEFRSGSYNGGGDRARGLLRFDVSAVRDKVVQSATLSLFEFHSWSCSPRWVDIRESGDFDPNTVTWNSQPWIGNIVANANVAFGYNSSCAANWVNFNMTGHAQYFADSRHNYPNIMALAVQAGSETDNAAWKKFNSGNASGGVPVMNFTYDGFCDQYAGNTVCGAIRDKYYSVGGPWGSLGMPTTGDTPINGGAYNHFQGGSIYWSAATGAHIIRGAIRDKWAQLGWETSYLGYPTTDETCGLVGGGCYNIFQNGGIYWTSTTGAHNVQGAIWNKWAQLGWETSPNGYPTTDEICGLAGGGCRNGFQNGGIYWTPATSAHSVAGTIAYTYGQLGAETSYLGYPTSDEYSIAGGRRSDFSGGQITWDATTGTAGWGAGPSSAAGTPSWATNLSFQLSDLLTATVNVGTGNLNVGVAGLTVPGVGGDRGIGMAYNSLAVATGSVDPTGLLGPGFRLSESPDVRLVAYPDGSVRYIDPSGRAMVYEWNPATSTYASPPGEGGTGLTRDGSNNWVLTTFQSNRKQTFRAADGLLIQDSDRNGVAYTFTYTSAGKPTSITGTRGGSAVTFTIGGTGVPSGFLGGMSQTVGGSTRSVAFGYDSSNRLSSISDAVGGTTTLGWTGNDLTSITPPAGKKTQVGYDTSHRVTTLVRDYVSGGYNATTHLAYGSAGIRAQTTVADPNSHVTTYQADAFGRVLQGTDALGHIRQNTYSPNNDVTSAVDAMPAANTMTYSYSDAAGGFTPTGATAPTGASATATYPSTGNGPLRYLPSSTKDPQGNVTTVSYDAVGNPTQQVTGGVTTSTTYNPPAGQATICRGGGKPGQACTQTDGNGKVTTFTYDGSGNLQTLAPPAGAVHSTQYTYDSVGRVATMTDGNGRVTAYVYDKNDRIKQIRYDGASSCAVAANCQQYDYDGNGNLTQRIDAAGTTSYSYDALNRLTSQTSPAASGGGARTSTLSYDQAGNLLTFSLAGEVTTYGYDIANNLTSLAEPGGSCTGTVSLCTTYTYNANDARTKITYPGGTTVEMLDIDASGRPRQYKAAAGGAVVMDLRYTFAAAGGDSGLVQTRTDATVAGNAVTTYSYDGLDRLTRARETAGTTVTASWTYCYDGNGNRTFDSTSTAATVLCPGQSGGPAPGYTYDNTNALIGRAGMYSSDFGYDGNGAELRAVGSTMRTAAAWNPRQQLAALTSNGTAHSYSYAGEGNKERLSFDGAGYQQNALGLTTQTGINASTVIREPNGTPVALRIPGGGGYSTASYYFIADRQQSTIALVNSTGGVSNRYSYDPYGVQRSATEAVGNPWQYIGGYRDSATGLYHLQTRYYDATIGRFTQTDPSGQEQNPYTYAASNPINQSDPSGLWSLSISGSACAFGVCIEGGIGIDDDGDVSVSGGVGTGVGASVGFEANDDGDYEEGYGGVTGTAACNAGPLSASVSQTDDEDPQFDTSYTSSAGIGCSASVSTSYTF